MADAPPRAHVTGLGIALPSRKVTNKDLEKVLDTSDEWIRERTGIECRYFVGEGEATSDLGIAAGRQALEEAGVAPEDVDMVIVGTFTEDHQFPATACLVQEALGCKNAGAFDLQAACTGWIAAVSTGAMWIQGGGAQRVLVIGADATTSVLNMRDRTTAVLFGDGGSAVMLEARPAGSPGLEIASTYLRADGSGAKCLHMPAGGSRQPATVESVQADQHYIHMEGRATFKFAVKALAESLREACGRAGLAPSDVAQVIPHQANLRIIEAAAKRVSVPVDRWFVNIDRYGNTVAASIGLALYEARAEGKVGPGDAFAVVGMGAGLTWGGMALRWNG